MAKFHINAKTGTPGLCRSVKGQCPFGSDAQHYSSKESAQAAFEADQSTFSFSGKKVMKSMKSLVRPHELDYDTIEHELKYIETWEEPWTPEEISNIALVQELSTIVARDPFTEDDEKAARDLIAKLHPYFDSRKSKVWDANDHSWRARDKMIVSLANALLIRRLADGMTHEPAEKLENLRMIGLQEAQELALKNYNRPTSDFYSGANLGNVEPHFQEAIARVKRGDMPAPSELLQNSDQRSLLPESERIFNTLHPDSPIYDQKMYLASVYPVNELKDEMDRVGIDNVSVSSLDNSREWGNIYTVMTPEGGTRSFAVYEHRNSDSIIINGKADWDGNGIPYAADSKNAFFAEFDPTDRKRSAQALTFYMMQAQSGTLESDEELVSKVSRRDWNAILDESIPGFRNWRQSKITDEYISPADETESEILKRLNF